jgi:ech hydrogenase subunit E
MKRTLTIPIGSQHISVFEPLRFELTTENETVIDAKADVGYVHRGIEQACAKKFKFSQVSFVVSRVCGLCAITHATAAIQAIENLFKFEIPKRAQYLRMLILELDRMHSHFICLGHVAENSGFEALFMRLMRDREHIMEIQEILTGNRVQFDYSCIGGVNRDISKESIQLILSKLEFFRERIDSYTHEFNTNKTLSLKFKGIGKLNKEDAYKLNVVGPMARACGIKTDVRARKTNPLPYHEIGYTLITEQDGDVHARNNVRLKELKNCCDMIEQILNSLPEGNIKVLYKGNPKGETTASIEAPRGELFYYIKANGKPVLERLKISTPTFSNIPAFIHVFKRQEFTNIPPIIGSYDPCLSCTAK